MQGQATHFRLYAPESAKALVYPNFRYNNECRRLYSILDKHLSSSSSGYLVGDHCSIADLAHFGWVSCSGWSGININEFPKLKEWQHRMDQRPAIQIAKTKPDIWRFKELPMDEKETEAFTKGGREWFIKLIGEDMKAYT